MGKLQPYRNTQSKLKIGIHGFSGSGKTTTAYMLAAGIAKELEGGRPIAFYDTEPGADFLLPKAKLDGLEILGEKGGTFERLLSFVSDAIESECSVLIVDSLTSIWRELCEARLKRINDRIAENHRRSGRSGKPRELQGLEFQHWGPIKRQWGRWTELYLNADIHIIVCGRGGYEYEYVKRDDSEKKDLQKSGTKMVAEGQFQYEPTLSLELVRVRESAEVGAATYHRCYVLKDKSGAIDGATFDFRGGQYDSGGYRRVWESVGAPVAAVLDRTTKQQGTGSGSSSALFDDGDGASAAAWKRRAEIALEEIQASIVALWPGQAAAAKKAKAKAIKQVFSTGSWKKVEGMRALDLERARDIFADVEATADGDDPEADPIEALSDAMERAGLRDRAIGELRGADSSDQIDCILDSWEPSVAGHSAVLQVATRRREELADGR